MPPTPRRKLWPSPRHIPLQGPLHGIRRNSQTISARPKLHSAISACHQASLHLRPPPTPSWMIQGLLCRIAPNLSHAPHAPSRFPSSRHAGKPPSTYLLVPSSHTPYRDLSSKLIATLSRSPQAAATFRHGACRPCVQNPSVGSVADNTCLIGLLKRVSLVLDGLCCFSRTYVFFVL